jgi:hypothetical protein
MGQYGTVTVKAVALIREKKCAPRVAWYKAAKEVFPDSVSSQDKGCPRNAFLGLCGEGWIKGVPSGNYTDSIKNKEYGITAAALLEQNPSLAAKKKVLWQETMRKTQNDENKKHNGQMDVVISLYNNKLLKESNGA